MKNFLWAILSFFVKNGRTFEEDECFTARRLGPFVATDAWSDNSTRVFHIPGFQIYMESSIIGKYLSIEILGYEYQF